MNDARFWEPSGPEICSLKPWVKCAPNTVPVARVRSDAGACAPANQRAKTIDTLPGSANSEAAGLSKDEGQAWKRPVAATSLSISRRRGGAPAILATPILRFQRVHETKDAREVGLYAREPGEAETGETSEGLAVEQFLVLRHR